MARILYFGKLQDVTGTSAETIVLPSNVENTRQLRVFLDEQMKLDGLHEEPSIRIAVNNVVVQEPAIISNDDEIAFMPPVGGG